MRRQIIVLFVTLLVAGAAFGGYPEEYYGPPLPDGCMDVEAYVPSGWFHDRNPWSMPSPEEGIFWFGTLCVEGGVAALEFTRLGSRRCYEAPWGTPGNPPICFAGYTIEISRPDRHVMAWDPDFDIDWGFYLASVHFGEWIWSYESLTAIEGNDMVFVTGVFEFITPLWYVESDDYTRWKFLVSPRTAKGFPMRRLVGRHGP
ncbi:MAG: hypothetical protein ACYSW8_25625 [Planctomycetota bacterium]|jgi:hypothetical protein